MIGMKSEQLTEPLPSDRQIVRTLDHVAPRLDVPFDDHRPAIGDGNVETKHDAIGEQTMGTFYQRHGFEKIGTIQAGTSPTMVPMLRRPQRP